MCIKKLFNVPTKDTPPPSIDERLFMGKVTGEGEPTEYGTIVYPVEYEDGTTDTIECEAGNEPVKIGESVCGADGLSERGFLWLKVMIREATDINLDAMDWDELQDIMYECLGDDEGAEVAGFISRILRKKFGITEELVEPCADPVPDEEEFAITEEGEQGRGSVDTIKPRRYIRV